MSSDNYPAPAQRLDISKWRNAPLILIVGGAIAAVLGVAFSSGDHLKQLGFSWLVGFMFCLSIGLGAFFLVMIHHLVDASWSVPIRRVMETLAAMLAPALLVLFLPIAFLASKIYPWMTATEQLHPDHALTAKYPWFTIPGFYVTAVLLFAIWWFFTNRLRAWSVKQDQTGAAKCTFKMRSLASFGIIFFAITVTLGSMMWMKGLMDEWYSTMYGVTYFAASVWMVLPTVYMIVLVLDKMGVLKGVVSEKTYYFIGSLFLAFTVFWAYVNFAQYFIVWNANMPEETFWYLRREVGTWKYVGQDVIIFGHFFVPFLMLLRIDWKLKLSVMFPLTCWTWLMHFIDMEFQITPALHKSTILNVGLLSDIGCVCLMVGILAKVFIASYARFAPFPQKDPRMAEALGIYTPPSSDISTAPARAK